LPNAATLVEQAIGGLRLGKHLRGIVLDLRSNGGGAPEGVAGLLGAFVHDKIWSYDIDRNGKRIANATNDTVPLLHQPLVVLTDRRCVSACDTFTGPAGMYLLDDGSSLLIPSLSEVGAHGETIDGIGVAPDDNVPLTAAALSAGHDPDLEKAVSLLRL